MARGWIDFVASVSDLISLPTLLLLLFLLATLVGALWYTWPAWIRPANWVRLWNRLLAAFQQSQKSTKAKKASKHGETIEFAPSEEELERELEAEYLPALSAEFLLARADHMAARGRYDLAVRERLRAIVRILIDHQVIGDLPGWTVTELAQAAAHNRPQVRPPLAEAVELFSDLWYGQLPAVADHDTRMRDLVNQVRQFLTQPVSPGGGER
jgi:hypothetical protein